MVTFSFGNEPMFRESLVCRSSLADVVSCELLRKNGGLQLWML